MKIALIACHGLLASLVPATAAVVGPASGSIVDGAQPATVMEVNPAGVGHVNLVPYFSTRSGFDTYLNLVNTDTRNGKAVKVRFRSAVNGEDIGNFTVLLGPGDAWAAALTRDAATGYARVVHGDKSCTLPADVQVTLGPTYVLSSFTPVVDVTRTHEGSVEIITMADIPRLDAGGQVSALYDAVTTSGSGSGPNCTVSALAPLAVDSSSDADARSKGLAVPTTGLMTEWTLINVPRAVSYTGRATAVEARVAAGGMPGYGNVVLFPQTQVAVADPVRTIAYTTNPNIRGGAPENRHGIYTKPVAAFSYVENQLPDLSTPYLSASLSAMAAGVAPRLQAFAVNKALATTSIGGEFATEPSILAKTDWVLTTPTRYLQVGYLPPGLSSSPSVVLTNLTVDDTGAPMPSGVRNAFETDINANYSWSIDPVCTFGIDPYTTGTPTTQPQSETGFRTREGNVVALQQETSSSGAVRPFELCGHNVVLRFAKPGDAASNGVLGDVRNRRQMISGATAGWGRIQIPGVAGTGLPVIGFAVSELYNSAVTPGVSGVFGLTFPLSTTKPAP